jgi:hypothetical protein
MQRSLEKEDMTAFISHSFENKPEFDNIVDALVHTGVPYWNPTEVKPGDSLRDQLRQAVERCSECIFVATRRALASAGAAPSLGLSGVQESLLLSTSLTHRWKRKSYHPLCRATCGSADFRALLPG